MNHADNSGAESRLNTSTENRNVFFRLIKENIRNVVKTLFLLPFPFYFYFSLNIPDDPLVFRIMEYTTALGFFIFVIPTLIGFFIEAFKIITGATKGQSLFVRTVTGYGYRFYRSIVAFTFFTFLIWTIGLFGDIVFSWALDNQEDGLAAFSALVLIALAFQFFPRKVRSHGGTDSYSSSEEGSSKGSSYDISGLPVNRHPQ